MNYTSGIPDLAESFTHLNILGAGWLITAIVIFLTLLLISRDPKDWEKLTLPVSIGWYMSGLKLPLPIILITGIIWAVSILGDNLIGQILTSRTDPIKRVIERAQQKKIQKAIMKTPETTTTIPIKTIKKVFRK